MFENGKAARIPVAAYETKTNRRRLTGAYSDKSPLIAVLPLYEGSEVAVFASDGRALLFPPEAIALKASRTTQGVAVMALKKKAVVTQAQFVPIRLSTTMRATAPRACRQPVRCCARTTAVRSK